jgi:hypothetical protein
MRKVRHHVKLLARSWFTHIVIREFIFLVSYIIIHSVVPSGAQVVTSFFHLSHSTAKYLSSLHLVPASLRRYIPCLRNQKLSYQSVPLNVSIGLSMDLVSGFFL